MSGRISDTKMVRLERELGWKLIGAIFHHGNTSKLREFGEGLVKDGMRTEMTIGGRTYDSLGFLRGDEKSMCGPTMVDRVNEMSANLGEDDGQHLLKNQRDIPVIFQGVVFVFIDWRHPDDPGCIYCVFWDEGSDHWIRDWFELASVRWGEGDRVLRPKSQPSAPEQT